MNLVGVIGQPLGHTLSPRMHHAAFAGLGLNDWRYEAWETAPSDVAAFVQRVRETPALRGFNITIPHKQAMLHPGLLDDISPHAAAIGAVNTVVKQPDGRLLGDNTDWLGVLADLRAHALLPGSGAHALLLGAGGSARGVAYALLSAGLRVGIVNRDPARAAQLAQDLRHFGDARALATVGGMPDAALLVNCTSVGMHPNDAASPWPQGAPLPRNAAVYDLIYKPRETVLMRQARAAGLRTVDGLGMLVEQGAAAFAMWTGRTAAEAAPLMRAALI